MKKDFNLKMIKRNGEVLIKTSTILRQFGVDDTISSLFHGGRRKTVNLKYRDLEGSMRKRGRIGGAFYFNIHEFFSFLNRYEPREENKERFEEFKRFATRKLHIKQRQAQTEIPFQESVVKIPLSDTFKFAEFTGLHYVKLHGGWIHKFADQRKEENIRTTEQLYDMFLEEKKLFEKKLGNVGVK